MHFKIFLVFKHPLASFLRNTHDGFVGGIQWNFPRLHHALAAHGAEADRKSVSRAEFHLVWQLLKIIAPNPYACDSYLGECFWAKPSSSEQHFYWLSVLLELAAKHISTANKILILKYCLIRLQDLVYNRKCVFCRFCYYFLAGLGHSHLVSFPLKFWREHRQSTHLVDSTRSKEIASLLRDPVRSFWHGCLWIPGVLQVLPSCYTTWDLRVFLIRWSHFQVGPEQASCLQQNDTLLLINFAGFTHFACSSLSRYCKNFRRLKNKINLRTPESRNLMPFLILAYWNRELTYVISQQKIQNETYQLRCICRYISCIYRCWYMFILFFPCDLNFLYGD